MDSLARSVLAVIVERGSELARDLIIDGVDLVLKRARGDHAASDKAVLEWLRDVQTGGSDV